MPHQHPHSHSHHEPSRHLLWPTTNTASTSGAIAPVHSRDVVNPRILDASIHDVAERLSNEQKAEVLIHAMNLLKLANPFSPRIVENGVMSCLQASDLGIPQRIQALLLRGRARMSAGDMAGARDDLRKVLELNPEHAVATSLLSMPSSGAHAPSKTTRLWTISSASRRLSPEVWRTIASFLPRRDLKTLLSLPHILSRIAFERVFERVDLTIGAVSSSSPISSSSQTVFGSAQGAREEYDEDGEDDRMALEDASMSDDRQHHHHHHRHTYASYTDEDAKLEKTLHQRTADIISRIVMDPGFAKLVKTLRISASVRSAANNNERRGGSNHLTFQTTMLMSALPRLINLQELIFTGHIEVWNTLATQLGSTHPRLASLTVEPEYSPSQTSSEQFNTVLPHLTQLHQLKLTLTGAHANPRTLPSFLAQNRSTLKKVCVSAAAGLPFSSSSSNVAPPSPVVMTANTSIMNSSHPFADLLLPNSPAVPPASLPAPPPTIPSNNPLTTLLPLAQLTHISLRSTLVPALEAFTGLLGLVLSTSSSGQQSHMGGACCANLVSLRVACYVPGNRPVGMNNNNNSSGNSNSTTLMLTLAEHAAVNACSNALMALATARGTSTPAFSALKHFGFRISPDYGSTTTSSGAGSGQGGQSISSMPSSPMSSTSSGPGIAYNQAQTQNQNQAQQQIQSQTQAPPLFQSLAAFLRTHPQLERLELLCTGDSSSSSRTSAQPRSRYHSSSPFSGAPSPAPSYSQPAYGTYQPYQAQPYQPQHQQQQQQNQQQASTTKVNLGYDASILGLLPSLPAVRVLAISITRDVSAGLFAWIVPRGVEALVLNGLEARRGEGMDEGMGMDGPSVQGAGEWEGVRTFLSTMQQGLPQTLSFLALLDVADDPSSVLGLPRTRAQSRGSLGSILSSSSGGGSSGSSNHEASTSNQSTTTGPFPQSVKVVRLGGRYYTVARRHGAGSTTPGGMPFSAMSITTPPLNGEGHSSSSSNSSSSSPMVLEEWPARSAALNAEEWVEALGCGEGAIWDEFAPGKYPVPLSANAVIFGSDEGYGVPNGSSSSTSTSTNVKKEDGGAQMKEKSGAHVHAN